MENILDRINIAIKYNLLWEVMGWDAKHGPTVEQIAAFKVLFPDADMDEALPAFKISMENGDHYVTSMAKDVTLEIARDYFMYSFHTYSDETRSRIVNVEQV